VGNSLGVHALKKAQVIDMPGNVGEKLGDILSALTIFFEAPEIFKNALVGNLSGFRQSAGIIKGSHLPVVFFQDGLVVKGIDVAWAALHEEENNAFGSGEDAAWLREQGIGHGLSLLGRQTGCREIAKPTGRGLESLSSRHPLSWVAVGSVGHTVFIFFSLLMTAVMSRIYFRYLKSIDWMRV
jgi:hypothetical protein